MIRSSKIKKSTWPQLGTRLKGLKIAKTVQACVCHVGKKYIKLSGYTVGGIVFANDFVGITESAESLKQPIATIHDFCSKWRLCANVNKSAGLMFGRDKLKGT